jgi:hypothetical protein
MSWKQCMMALHDAVLNAFQARYTESRADRNAVAHVVLVVAPEKDFPSAMLPAGGNPVPPNCGHLV